MGQHHLTSEARKTLQRCLAAGFSLRQIGVVLGYSAAALCKEKKRNSMHGRYDGELAQIYAARRRKRAGRRKKQLCQALEEYIFEKIGLYWSPEQVQGRLVLDYPADRAMRISFKTIYRRIAHGVDKRTKWAALYHFLRLKRQRKSLRNWASRTPGPDSRLPSIEERPAIVNERSRFGDWESDLLCGPIGKGFIATFVERSTGIVLAAECPLRTPECYEKIALKVLGSFPSHAIQTVTTDRGTEFYAYRRIEQKLGTRFYFCHPRNPNERGLNEQINGLLRQFFPKRKVLRNIGDELKRAVALINHRPRKRLGYKTPVEMLEPLGLQQVLTLLMTI